MTIGKDERIPTRHFDGQANITGDRPGQLSSILNNVFDGVTRNGETVEPLDIWVSTDGHDETGDGSENNPYRSPARAFDDIPFRINHPVHVRLLAGEYDDCPSRILHSFNAEGALVLEGVGDPTVVAGPFAVTSFTNGVGNDNATYLQVAGAGWTVNQFYNKWVRVTGGTAAGFVWPIHNNSVDTIVTALVFGFNVGTITEIEILDAPPVTLNVPNGISIAEASQSNQATEDAFLAFRWWAGSKIAIGGVRFLATNGNPLSHTIRDTSIFCAFTMFESVSCAVDPFATVIEMSNSYVNYWEPVDGLIFDNVLYNDKSCGGILFSRGGTPYAGAFGYCGFVNNCNVEHIVTQYELWVSSAATFNGCCLGRVTFDTHGFGLVRNSYIDPIGMTQPTAITVTGPKLALWFSHIENSPGADAAIQVWKATYADIIDVTGNQANIPSYGIDIGEGATVVITDGTTLSGLLNEYIWHSTKANGSYPGPTAMITDSLGAFLINEG